MKIILRTNINLTNGLLKLVLMIGEASFNIDNQTNCLWGPNETFGVKTWK